MSNKQAAPTLAGANTFFRVKSKDLNEYERMAYWGARVGVLILSAASVVFSYKYFDGWFLQTSLPDWLRFALASLATLLISFMIGNLLNWVIASAARGIWSGVLTVAAVLVAGLLAFDLYGNIVGGEQLAEVVIATAERGTFRYSEQDELEKLKADVQRIDDTHTARDRKTGEKQTWVSGEAKKTKNSLNASIAYHEARKLKEQADFDTGYDEDVKKAEQRLQASVVGLYWFNALMYVVMIGLYILIHAIEIAAEKREGIAPTPVATPAAPAATPAAPAVVAGSQLFSPEQIEQLLHMLQLQQQPGHLPVAGYQIPTTPPSNGANATPTANAAKYAVSCAHCGTEFKANTTRHKYCSDTCRQTAWTKANPDKVGKHQRIIPNIT